MTTLIDVKMVSELTRKVGIKKFLSEMTEMIQADFLRWTEFDKSARVGCHSDIGVIELMPIADNELFGFKYVNGHPINTSKGFSTVMAFGALSSVETGYPLLLSELTLTTAFRTAATSVMAARALARKNSKRMAIFGCGAQSEFQAIAFHAVLGINEISIFDVDKEAMSKLKSNLSLFPEIKVTLASSPKDNVNDADIITTVTADKAYATIVTPDMVEPGVHINGVGGDCPGKTELHADVLRSAKIFVEYEPQTRIEGDIQQLADDHPVHALWQVLTEDCIGRESDEQITIFDSVGFALEDFSALKYVLKQSEKFNIGKKINLVPEFDGNDPKDLFALTQDGKASLRRVA